MQFLVLFVNAVLNTVLLLVGASAVLRRDDQTAVDLWTYCLWSSAVLLFANLLFCTIRMVLLWRQGKKEQSLWGMAVLGILPVGGYYL